MKKIIRVIALCCVFCVLFSGCGVSEQTIAEVGAALEELLPKSYEINEIYFGKGLPVTEDSQRIQDFYHSIGAENSSVKYHPVDEVCGYASVEEIQTATLAVYTEAYAEHLFARAFTGVSDSMYDMTMDSEVETSVSYARYKESEGYLTVRLDLEEEAFDLNRTYDPSDFQIVIVKSDYVIAEVQSYVDGQKDIPVSIKLVKTENGFRLDTPTY